MLVVFLLTTGSHAAGTLPLAPVFELSIPSADALTVGRCYPSGFRVVAEHDPRQALVAVTLMLGTRSGAEPGGMSGLAHLAEHLWFRARPGGGPSIEDRLAAMGATSNAYTLQDVVMFETVVPREHLEDVLELEALRFGLGQGAWTEDVLTTERQIIAHEMRDRDERTWMVDAVRDQLFPAPHPYSAAAALAVPSATLADVARWWGEHGRPDNATLIVRGDWSPYQVHALAATVLPLAADTKGHCAERNDGAVTPPRPAPLDHHKPRRAPVDARSLLIAWSLPAAFRDDDWAMRGLASRIENYIVARVLERYQWQATRLRMNPTCHWWAGAQGSSLTCLVPLPWHHLVADAFRLVTEEIDEMDQVPFLRLMEYQTWATHLSKVEETGAALRSRGVLSTLEPDVGDLVLENDLLAHFAGVANPVERRIHAAQRGSADISKIARAYITPERAVWVELLPERGGEVAPLAMISAKVSVPPTDNFGHSVTVAPPRLGTVRELRLDNGLRVVMVPFGNAPMVHVALVDEGPSLGDALDWTHMAFDIGGTVPTVGDRFGVPGLTLAAWAIGSELDRVLLDGRPTYRLNASSDDLGSALYLVRIAGPESTLASDSVRLWNKQVKKQKPEPAVTAWYAGLEALLGSETTKNVRGATLIDKTALVRQHELWHRPETSTLYVVGKIEDDAELMVRAAFEGWAAPAVAERLDPPASPVVLPDRTVPTTVVVDDQGRASVSLACRMPRYSLAERSLLQHAVQDSTYLEARERQGLVYTPWVGTIDLGADVSATLLLVGGSTDAETAGQLLEALDSSVTPTASGWWERARGEASVERALQIHGLAGLTEALAAGEVLLDGTVRWEIDDSRADAIRADLESCRRSRFAMVIGPRAAVEKSLGEVHTAARVAE